MVVLLEGSHISTEELCQSSNRILSHLPDQGLSPPISQFGHTASSTKSLGGSKHVPFKNDRGHCVLGTLNAAKNVLVPFPSSVPLHNPVSELYGQLFRLHGLVFVLTCTVNRDFVVVALYVSQSTASADVAFPHLR